MKTPTKCSYNPSILKVEAASGVHSQLQLYNELKASLGYMNPMSKKKT